MSEEPKRKPLRERLLELASSWEQEREHYVKAKSFMAARTALGSCAAELRQAISAAPGRVVITMDRLVDVRTGQPVFLEVDPDDLPALLEWSKAGDEAGKRLREQSSEDGPIEPREEVMWFARQMERKLRKHDDKPGWKDASPHWLFGRILNEFNELYVQLEADVDPAAIVSEAADVANFAMMIADVIRKQADDG